MRIAGASAGSAVLPLKGCAERMKEDRRGAGLRAAGGAFHRAPFLGEGGGAGCHGGVRRNIDPQDLRPSVRRSESRKRSGSRGEARDANPCFHPRSSASLLGRSRNRDERLLRRPPVRRADSASSSWLWLLRDPAKRRLLSPRRPPAARPRGSRRSGRSGSTCGGGRRGPRGGRDGCGDSSRRFCSGRRFQPASRGDARA